MAMSCGNRGLVAPLPAANGLLPAAHRQRLAMLDHFRTLAILQIVLLHVTRAYMIRGLETPAPETNLLFALNDALFHNATLYFTLISGLLYTRLSARHGLPRFYGARFRNVVLPYILVSVALTVLSQSYWVLAGGDPWLTAALLAENIVLGEAFYTLWYIPVIVLLYLASPFLLAIVSRPHLRPVAVLLILLPLVMSRTDTEVTVSTILYFCGAYVLGLALSLDLEAWLDRLASYQPTLLVVVLISTAAILYLYLAEIRYAGMVDIRESLYYVQKLALAGLFLVWLRPTEVESTSRIARASTSVAAMAFAIYFLHAPIARKLVDFLGPFGDTLTVGWTTAAQLAFLFVATLGLCLVAVYAARAILGRRSRCVIGA